MISKITDKILPEVNEWQNRPLESIYPIIYFDGIFIKSRKDNQIISKCVYTILGINMDGQKDIPGTWISESAGFWAGVHPEPCRGIIRYFVIMLHFYFV